MRALLLIPALAFAAAAQTPLPELLPEAPADRIARDVERCVAGPIRALPGGDTAPLPAVPLDAPEPAPMPNWCSDAAPRAVLPPGARFPLTAPELDPYDFDTLSDETLRRHYLDQLRDRYPYFEPRERPGLDELGVPDFERIPLDGTDGLPGLPDANGG